MTARPVRRRLPRMLAWAPAGLLLVAVAGCLVALRLGGLTAVFAWYFGQLGLPALSIVTLAGTLVYSVWSRRMSATAVVTTAAAFAATLPALLLLGYVDVAYPSSVDDTRPWATVRLPTDLPVLVAWGGDSIEVNYHAVAPDQRWAYDLLIEPVPTDGKRLDAFGCWNTPVLAPAAGTIVIAHDGEPDLPPGRRTGLFLNPGGNHVALRLETGTYLIVAHLRQGTVAVAVGDRVAEGRELGRCGNSGNTSGPHIHLHHQRQDPSRFPRGLAEGLPLFFRDHDGLPMPTGGLRTIDGRQVWVGDRVRHRAGP